GRRSALPSCPTRRSSDLRRRSQVLKTFRDLSRYLVRHRTAFIVMAVLILFNGFFSTLAPIIPGRVIDGLRVGSMTLPSLWLHVGALLGVALISGAAMVVTRRLVLGASWDMQLGIRLEIFVHVTRLDGGYFDRTRVGELMARLSADLYAVRMMIGIAIYQAANISVLFAFTLYRMFQLSPSLTLVTL